MALDRARVLVGLEMIPTVLPIHDPADMKNMNDILQGVPWGKVAFALAADVYMAFRRHPEGDEQLNAYMDFLVEVVGFIRGERDFPEAIQESAEVSQLFKNRLLTVRKQMDKAEAKAEAKS